MDIPDELYFQFAILIRALRRYRLEPTEENAVYLEHCQDAVAIAYVKNRDNENV